jgi:hypothetical protein
VETGFRTRSCSQGKLGPRSDPTRSDRGLRQRGGALIPEWRTRVKSSLRHSRDARVGRAWATTDDFARWFEHIPEKWKPVFRKRICDNKEI